MLYYFDINTCIVTTVSGVSDTLTRRATLRLQLVHNIIMKYFYNVSLIFYENCEIFVRVKLTCY